MQKTARTVRLFNSLRWVIAPLVILGVPAVSLAQIDPARSYQRPWSIQLRAGGQLGLPTGDYYKGSMLAAGFHASALLPIARKIGMSGQVTVSGLSSDKNELVQLAGPGSWAVVQNDFRRRITTIELSLAGFGAPRLVPNLFGYSYVGLGCGFLSHSGDLILQSQSSPEQFRYSPSKRTIPTAQIGIGASWFFSRSVGLDCEVSYQTLQWGKSEGKNIDGAILRFMIGITVARPRVR